jgi:UDP-N-acetylglucosamine 2-epimerase (non-hydrolysing)
MARLVGTDPERIVAETERLLHDDAAHDAMTGGPSPYGDGQAAVHIADHMETLKKKK